MKKYYMSFLAALTMTTSSAFAGGPDDFIGSMWPTAAQFCPQDTVEAYGQLLSVQQYTPLYVLYGTTYGGDGKTTFGVPDMRGRMPIGAGTIPNTSTVVKRGTPLGQETTTLTQTSLATHTHTATFTRDPMTVNIPVSSTTATKSNTPSPTNPYLSASSSSAGADMWAGTSGTAPVALAEVSSSGGVGNGSVTVAPTGTATPAAITTIPPQLGVRFCIVTMGSWPQDPNN
jgi:microcystin-dependent protein